MNVLCVQNINIRHSYSILMLASNTINIRLGRETHQRLLKTGDMGDTFDTLINRILDENEYCKKNHIKK